MPTTEQTKLGDAVTELGVDAVAGIDQHNSTWHTRQQGSADLPQRDPRLGLEGDGLRHAGLAPTGRIVGPRLGQVELVGDRQAGVVVGHRQADRDLAIVLLAELPAILPRHADRLRALLGVAGVVDDPGVDRAVLLDGWQHLAAHRGQHRLVRPVRLGDQMMQRLLRRLHPLRLQPGRHRLDALALTRQQQPGAVGLERRGAISVAEFRNQRIEIGVETGFTATTIGYQIHKRPPYR
jgi:hypothetical protein